MPSYSRLVSDTQAFTQQLSHLGRSTRRKCKQAYYELLDTIHNVPQDLGGLSQARLGASSMEQPSSASMLDWNVRQSHISMGLIRETQQLVITNPDNHYSVLNADASSSPAELLRPVPEEHVGDLATLLVDEPRHLTPEAERSTLTIRNTDHRRGSVQTLTSQTPQIGLRNSNQDARDYYVHVDETDDIPAQQYFPSTLPSTHGSKSSPLPTDTVPPLAASTGNPYRAYNVNAPRTRLSRPFDPVAVADGFSAMRGGAQKRLSRPFDPVAVAEGLWRM